MSYFIIVAILIQEMLRPNPATNQTGFCCSLSLSVFTRGKKASKSSARAQKTRRQSHLEGIHVHWVDEGVVVKSRHCGGKFTWCEINKTTALVTPAAAAAPDGPAAMLCACAAR